MGEWFALASALCFGIANVTVMRGARPGDDDNGAFLSLLLTIGIAGIGWLVWGATAGFVPVSGQALAWFAAAGVFAAFVGRVFLYASIQHLGAMRAATVKRLNPFFAVLLGLMVLGETATGGMVWGALLIVVSFAVLLLAQWRSVAPAASDAASGATPSWRNIGYVYGPVAALGYALGNLLRKFGLELAPDPLLGALVGTAVGALVFVGVAGVNGSYRRALRGSFRRPRPWLWVAGIMASLGQILTFVALGHSPMSTVALVVSMEVFITIGLSLLVSGERLTPRIAIAALLGFAGTALLVLR